MADLGFLNFGIGVDGEDLLAKALEKDKKEALEVQKILASIKIEGINFGGAESAVAKSQQDADKAAISSVKLGEAREHAASSSLIGEQKLQTEIEKTAAIQGKSAAEISSIQKQAADKAAIAQSRIATESQKAAAIQNAAADKSRVSVASLMAMERERAAKQAIYQQKLATEFQRTEAARSRAQLAMVTGERNANNAIGMTNKTMFSQKELLRQLSNAAGIYFSIYQVGAFVKNLALVSGEFEMQRISLENILQDVDAANKLFGQIKTLAVISPFEFKDLVGYAKQLSAFSIPANELYDTTKRLADVSSGLGVDMGRIILAYGQVRSASVLRGQELRQFTEAGIPLVDELAKKFGELEGRVVSAGEVFDKISNRLVPFAMVKDVFNDLTSEGGKFFEMQERQSESLKGKIANLKDAYDIMLYSIGTANDGILKGGVEGITSLMKNWETVATILKEIIITYGTYKATIIAVAAAEKAWTAIQITNRAAMVATAISGSKVAAMLDLLTSKLSNISKTQWWGIALASIAALGYGIYSVYQSIHKLDNELNEIINKSKASADASIIALDNLIIRVRNTTKGSQEYSTAIGELNRRYGEYLPNLITESDSLTDIEEKLKGVTAAIYEKAKAQSYSQSVDKIEEELSDSISEAYDSALNSLTTSGLMGYDQLVMSKEDANKFVASVFSQIKSSPEVYKGEESVRKLIGDSMSKAFSDIKGIKIESFYDVKQFGQLSGFIEGVYEYADAISSLSEKQQYAYDKSKALYGETESYVSEVEKVNVKYAGLEAGINKKVYADSENGKSTQRNTDLFEMQKTKLLELIGVYKKFGQFDLAKGIQSQFDILIQSGQKWVVTAKEIVGENKSMLSYSPQDNEQIFDYVDRIKSAYKGLKEQQKQIEGGLLAPDISKEAIPEQIKGIESLALALGFLLNAGKNEKDSRVEPLQKEIALIKEAYDEYVKLQKVMSKPMAMQKIKEQERYKKVDVPVDELGMANKNKEYADKLIKLNSKDGKSAADAFNKSYTSGILAIDTDVIDKFMKKVGDEIDKFKDSYDFYEKLLGAGEDKQTAIKIAFGVEFEGQSIDPMRYFSDKIKEAAKAAKFNLDFDINKGSIKDQIGDAYDDLTPELKKQIDALENYRIKSTQDSYLKYLSFINKETPTGTGITFDFSKVLSELKKGVNDANREFNDLNKDTTGNIDKGKLKEKRDLEISYDNEVALNKSKDIGAEFLERSLKNNQYYEEYKHLNNASYADTKKILESLGKIKEDVFSKDGLAKIFSTNSVSGNKQDEADKQAFNPILGELGNTESIIALNEQVDLYLQNITEHKEQGIELDEKMKGLNSEQLTKLQLILTFIKSISKAIGEAEGKTEKIKLQGQVAAFKKLGNAANDVLDGVDGLADAFGAEFDDVTKGALEVVKTIVSTSLSVASTITDVVTESGTAMKASSETASDSIKTVERASVILAIIGAALQIATKIASIFTGNKTKKADDAIKEQQEQLDDLQRSYDQTEKSAEKFYTLEADSTSISKWLSSEKAAINARYGYLKRFGKMGEEALNSMYKNAEKEAKSMENMSVLQVQQKNMEQQKRALKEQIKAAEGDNKKGKRNDEIDGYKNQLKDLDEKLAETRDKWYETLRGFSMQDVANDFAEAWVEAFEKGEDSIEALDKKFNELIKNMIIKQAAMRVVSKIMQPMLDMIDTAIGEDGVLTENEIGGIMGALPDTLKKINDGMNGIIKPLLDKMGITFGSASEAGEGLSKSIAGVTEDTANLLASYLNAMRADLANQKIYFQKIIDAIIPMSNNFALQVAELKKIEANTYRTANNTEENVKILGEVKAILKSITTQGSGKKVNI